MDFQTVAGIELSAWYAKSCEARKYFACHGALDGFTSYEKLGGKLRPEWMAQFIAGEVKYKPRHWLAHRMPAFPKYAADFATGLAMTHGLPPVTPLEPPQDLELAKVGQKLIGVDGGFSCISCHSVHSSKSTRAMLKAMRRGSVASVERKSNRSERSRRYSASRRRNPRDWRARMSIAAAPMISAR